MPAPSVGTPTLNSKWRVDVDPDDNGTFLQVKGISSFTPARNDTIADNSDFDTGRWGADAVTQSKWQLQFTVGRKRYSDAYDPGQEALIAATEVDEPVAMHVRWYERISGGKAYEGYALVQWNDQGGDGAGVSTAQVVLLGQGARTAIANPFTGTALPEVHAVTPTSLAAAGGDLVDIDGANFTGATAVKFGTTNATDFDVLNDGQIAAVAPAHTAGTVDVTVVTAAGTSATSTDDQVTYA